MSKQTSVKDFFAPVNERRHRLNIQLNNDLKLDANQASILKVDLHFSHKDEAVLKLMQLHNIFPLYVPAACTDIIQECDTVVNKPFKNGVKAAFRDHMHHLFDVHIERGGQPFNWKAKLNMGDLKPFITSFVETGVAALKTVEMKAAIIKAFEQDGLFNIIRSEEQQLIAEASIAARTVEESNLRLPFTWREVRQTLAALNDNDAEQNEDDEVALEDNNHEDNDAAAFISSDDDEQ
jgi:hypothetical protein